MNSSPFGLDVRSQARQILEELEIYFILVESDAKFLFQADDQFHDRCRIEPTIIEEIGMIADLLRSEICLRNRYHHALEHGEYLRVHGSGNDRSFHNILPR